MVPRHISSALEAHFAPVISMNETILMSDYYSNLFTIKIVCFNKLFVLTPSSVLRQTRPDFR